MKTVRQLLDIKGREVISVSPESSVLDISLDSSRNQRGIGLVSSTRMLPTSRS